MVGLHSAPLYALTLWLHSWVRWAVLLFTVATVARATWALIRRRPWTARDDALSRRLVILVDLQLTLGLLLYAVLSPLVAHAWTDMATAMKSRVLRFFSIEHAVMMVFAVAVVHVGRARVRKATSDSQRFRRQLAFTLGFLALVGVAIPWPGLGHGRPWARTTLPPSVASEASAAASTTPPEIYVERCAPCHGPGGRGDGLAAGTMRPSPRNFTDEGWQSSRTDDQIRAVILGGGQAVEASANMPSFPTTTTEELELLLAFIRSRPPNDRRAATRR